jgi:transposase-like protein
LLSPEERWELFLEVTSEQLSQPDAARKWDVDVHTVINVRRLVKDAALVAFASSRPGRPVLTVEQAELERLRVDNARLSEALKELAIEVALLRGRQRSGFSARSGRG